MCKTFNFLICVHKLTKNDNPERILLGELERVQLDLHFLEERILIFPTLDYRF